MNKKLIVGVAGVGVAVLGAFAIQGAMAGGKVGDTPNGAHYTLNIHGVPKGKTASMTGSDTKNIFVPLEGKTKINLTEGPFQVLDGNGTDGVAAFQLPAADANADGISDYSVYARALGKPGGSSTMTTCITDTLGVEYCSVESVVSVRDKGASQWSNVSKQLLTAYVDTDGDGSPDTRVPLFSDDNYTYAWDYDNQGLRLLQLRFYPEGTSII